MLNTKNHILVSIIMPVFNGAKFLEESIKSILTQSHSNFEFIIVDNNSTDESEFIISQFANLDNRIKFIKEKKQGIANALNTAIRNTSGEYIFRMDSDDISSSSRIEETIVFMKHNNLNICGTFIKKFGKSNSYIQYPISDRSIRFALKYCSPFAHPTVCFNSSIKERINYLNIIAEDLHLWRTLASYEDIVFGNVPQYLFMYRTHVNQTVNQNSYKNYSQLNFTNIFQNIKEISIIEINLKDKLFISRNYLGAININLFTKLFLISFVFIKNYLK